MNIYDYFLSSVNNFPEKTALHFENIQLSYQQLSSRVQNLAAKLSDMGIKKNTHIALFLNNSIEFAEIMLASAALGATIVPFPLSLKGEFRQIALKTTKCSFAIGWFSIMQQLKDEKYFHPNHILSIGGKIDGCSLYDSIHDNQKSFTNPDVSSDLPYILTMTSGSTGTPKPIIFTQQTKINRAFEATQKVYGLDSNDVILVGTPLYHSLAQRSLLLPLMIGATVVVLPKFSTQNWIEAVESKKVTFLFAVSSQLEILLQTTIRFKHNFSSLKTIISSSAPLKNETKLRLLETFDCDIREIYGASEIGVASELSIRYDHEKYTSVGKPLSFVDIKICNNLRHPLAVGEIGEIACMTATRFEGYFANSEATQAAFDEKGYFYTGDLGYMDDDGYLYFQGRKKELIITGGINVYPKDVEQILLNDINVEECAVIGIPDASFGEAVMAILVPHKGKTIDLHALRRHCAKELADFQQPLFYDIVEALPKNSLGKLMKYQLEEHYAKYNL